MPGPDLPNAPLACLPFSLNPSTEWPAPAGRNRLAQLPEGLKRKAQPARGCAQWPLWPASTGAAQVRRADAGAGQKCRRLGIERDPFEGARASRTAGAAAGWWRRARPARRGRRRGSARRRAPRSPSASSILWRTNSSVRRRPPGFSTRVAVDDDGVVERAAERQAGGAHRLDLLAAAEGAAVGELVQEGAVLHRQPPGLAADRGVGEVDLEVDREHLGRRELGDHVALHVADRPQHPDRPQRPGDRRRGRRAGWPWTKRSALPSMIGTSGPSMSISTWVTPVPASAAIRCSTVPTDTPAALVSSVQSRVSLTRSQRAGIRLSRSVTSTRRKRMPPVGRRTQARCAPAARNGVPSRPASSRVSASSASPDPRAGCDPPRDLPALLRWSI